MANKNLNAAKSAKKDEFYTQLTDIERELQHYWPHFRGKTVLCNCDDPYESNFFKYFALRFNQLGLKKLICTCYNGSPVQGNELLIHFDDLDAEPTKIAYKVEITEVKDLNGDGAVDLADVRYLLQNDRNVMATLESGDFRSAECIELLQQADVVVTNPPFSLFREYIGQLIEYGKKFIIVGHQNAITYKEVFPLIKENKVWLGYGFKGGAAHFFSPYEDIATAGDHRRDMIRVSGVTWFTNLEIPKRNEELDLVCRYSPEEYPKYQDYDAIEVSESNAVPYDYDGYIGVPITFLNFFNPEQFEILDCCEPCIRLDILRKMPKFKEYKSRQKICNGILCQKKYHRIIIKNKHPKPL
ncbi:adenine-specific methyltransferase EcoRI family protein [Prevotella sp. kh1p2]|uniref:adenine-specific methyltransferase EcoRI family protein n=1 Tax=Prevotella sp. kh1p2 TaxID=1761883 RepID=UPI0008C2384E|nr:adenine-specific methyltransferase EcoRI family protein [Prevotella sp. kh1p2]SET20757.1 Adenine-specific methyltransferase EcoRI [Prevotella sp. kh1p2]SNU12249.1 Adenine-specific methyltransferase EcoRI [Prevotellaceae bacterium KH2P17]